MFLIDHGIQKNVFVTFQDIDHPNEKSRNCSYYISQTSFVKTVKPTASTTGKNNSKRFTLKKSKRYSKNNKRKYDYSSEEETEEEVTINVYFHIISNFLVYQNAH